jgi:hypothetical protein
MIWIEPGALGSYENHYSIGGGRTQQSVKITTTNHVEIGVQ